ncbi:hypothetical protein BDV33DRAFT_35063 [Aspergillus novoparasiticus]|uniref:Secreted protein n=1 Tax=Aspergillus novoparasiticus TaxID=986946 RepID=A0A5N6F2T4_9EURO|nr:hypothetical protein BDV33DRAFT_35063 [Aspergillus novoparasiticus]
MYLFRQPIPSTSLFLIVHLPGVVSAQSKIGTGGFSAKSLSCCPLITWLYSSSRGISRVNISSHHFSFSFFLLSLYQEAFYFHAFCKNRISGPFPAPCSWRLAHL